MSQRMILNLTITPAYTLITSMAVSSIMMDLKPTEYPEPKVNPRNEEPH